MGVGLTTLQRWRRQFAGDKDGVDGRKGSSHYVSQLVYDLADQGTCIGSERSLYRVLHAHGQLHLRGRDVILPDSYRLDPAAPDWASPVFVDSYQLLEQSAGPESSL